MLPDGSTPRTNIAVALFLIVFCGDILWETRTIPPGSFEPLGSAPVPQVTAGLIIALSLIVIARTVFALARSDIVRAADDDFVPRPLDAALTLALTIVYVFLLQLRVIPFAWLTTVFLFVAIGCLMRFRWRTLPVAAVIAFVMGFGCQYIFTRVFYVDLPAG